MTTLLEAPSHQHPAYATGVRELSVTAAVPLTEAVTHFELAAPDGGTLASYQPGSHLIVTAGAKRNAYSLTGDGRNPSTYGISVMRRGEGGGSDWLHDSLAPGDRLEVEGPRAMFAPVLDQRHALLVAGGIGVTPILSHARAVARNGGSAEVLYSYRPGHAAHLDDLRELTARAAITVHEATTVEETAALLESRLADQPLGTHAYACGPIAMLEAYERLTARAAWPAARVHLERFAAREQDPGEPFTARVASTGQVIAIPSGVSLLQRLLDSGVAVPSLCRQGVCGECRVPVRGGSVQHRDLVLSEEEKERGDTMLSCVSRAAASSEIEVDL